jgi:DNA-binding transcriptional MerR regulator
LGVEGGHQLFLRLQKYEALGVAKANRQTLYKHLTKIEQSDILPKMTEPRPPVTGFQLNIKAVAERTGVPLHTLRAWERRYGVPRPNRNTENRYRLYDEQDIADVVWMKRQVEAGVSPAQASAQLKQSTRELLPGAPVSLRPTEAVRAALFDALARQDETASQRILNAALGAFAPAQVLLEILEPAIKRIGDEWQRNLLSVEQEHFASNLARQRLHVLLQGEATPALTAPRLMAACAPEEQHDLGLLIFTWLARRHGWNVMYLGQRTPLADLAQASTSARFIALSVSTVTGLASLFPLWSEPLPPAPLLFGGEVFQSAPALREHLPGAYLGRDGAEALENLMTTTPLPTGWKPPRGLLASAHALDAERLGVASMTVRQFAAGARGSSARARREPAAILTPAALFLTDAVVSALAFDSPELMDLQGAWASDFMPAHNVSIPALYHFLEAYAAACAGALPNDAARAVRGLVARMAESVQENTRRAREEVA